MVDLAHSVGKEPRETTYVYVLPGEELVDEDRLIVDGVATLIRRSQLSANALINLRRQIDDMGA